VSSGCDIPSTAIRRIRSTIPSKAGILPLVDNWLPPHCPPAHREPLRVYRARFFAFSPIFTRRRMISGRPPPDREASQSRRVRSAAFFNAGFGPIRIPVQFRGRR
jgi:hypothetical protein